MYPRIGGSRADLLIEYNGIPCVRIEIQLMYKAKGRRPKDEIDCRSLGLKLKEWRQSLESSAPPRRSKMRGNARNRRSTPSSGAAGPDCSRSSLSECLAPRHGLMPGVAGELRHDAVHVAIDHLGRLADKGEVITIAAFLLAERHVHIHR